MSNSSTSRKFKRREKRRITVDDVKCSICLEILIFPVSLPCKHSLCKICFETNCRLANFECPMCRVRLSSWARKAKRNDLLVDLEKWEEIQRLFPAEIKKRLNNEEEALVYSPPRKLMSTSIAKPGEIKIEFEEMIKKLRYDEEQDKLREQKASEDYINNLLIIGDTSPSSANSSTNNMLEYTLSNIPDLNKPSSSNAPLQKPRSSSVESCDSISQEMSHFKPINAAPLTPPKKPTNGELLRPKVICTIAKRLRFEDGKAQQENSHVSSDRQIVNANRGNDHVYPLREKSNFLKSRDASTTTTGNTKQSEKCKGKESLKLDEMDEETEGIKIETAIFSKIEQERADFVLAQYLQDKYNNFLYIPRKVDRTKGSGNEYNFRKRAK